MPDKSFFTGTRHREDFLSLLRTDNTRPSDVERLALFFLLSGNRELYGKRGFVYDFKRHELKDVLSGSGPDFSSSTRSLLILGMNLYNGYDSPDASPKKLFWHLDRENTLLAINALRICFCG